MNFEMQAALIAAVFAVDTHGFGGVCLRAPACPARDQWMQILRDLLPADAPVRRAPCNIADSRLLGGLDLAATMRVGKPTAERGVLASTDKGVLVLAMAERLGAHTAAILCSALDGGEIQIAREGMLMREAARIGIVAFDEGISEDECLPSCLLDRCAFLLDFSVVGIRTLLVPEYELEHIDAARKLLPEVTIETPYVQALCATAMTLGAGSLRISLLAVYAARALAALDGRGAVVQADAETAGRLVLAPRASVAPDMNVGDEQREQNADTAEPPEPESLAQQSDARPPHPRDVQEMQDLVLAAVQASIPRGLLMQLRSRNGAARSARDGAAGRAGALRKGGTRGRPAGVSPAGAGRSRLNIFETLKAAAPWQAIRGRDLAITREAPDLLGVVRFQLRPEDLRMTRYQQRSRTLTVFVVDASGSSALNRLAETKGAVELLLADCYVRRDEVAVIAFRGRNAEVLLPPTRSLVRAKRSLSALPGGGGTPLAAAIDTAALMASHAKRRGESPTVVLLTDGRGNVARDGGLGREPGQADALRAAGAFARTSTLALLVDTSPRPNELAHDLAGAMNAAYFALPFADARSLSGVIASFSARPTAARSPAAR